MRYSTLLVTLVGCLLWSSASTHAADRPDRPAWLNDEPLIIAGNWDSADIFRIRKGGNPLWYDEAYKLGHSETAVRKLKELGVTMAIIHFFKGFGLEAEKEQLADARDLAALCRKQGIRVGVYIGSTIGHETFLLEQPAAAEWFVPDYHGQPVLYGTQAFRKRVYFMHPGYLDYIKRVVRIAIQDVGADMLHFDNTSVRARAEVFHHPLAKRHFREFLREKFSPADLKQRLGFNDVTAVEPPYAELATEKIDDPLMQEWADFRCRQLAGFYAEMVGFARSLKPDIVVDNNPHSGLSGINTVWEQGIDYPLLMRHTDIVWSEEGNDPGVSPEGILVSKIRSYKLGAALGNKILTYTSTGRLPMAESMAFNRQMLGMVGGMMAGFDPGEIPDYLRMENPYTWGGNLAGHLLTEKTRHYIDFYREQFRYFRDIESAADVAVFRSRASMAFNEGRPYDGTFLFEQSLIQNQVPFNIIFDENLADLSGYRVLVLADQESLSDAQLVQVRKFVGAGGGLVATGTTSLYTPERRRRRDFGLKELLGVEAPLPNARNRGQEFSLKIDAVRHRHGRGRVVYIPEVVPTANRPSGEPMTSEYWKLPKNAGELVDAVTWAAGGTLAVETNANQYTVFELAEQKSEGRLLLHMLNYNEAASPAADDIEVRLLVPVGRTVDRIEIVSPDRTAPEPLPHKLIGSAASGGQVQFTVPSLEVYNLVVIHLR